MRNTALTSLIGSKNFSFQVDQLKDSSFSAFPETVLDNQLGVAIFRSGRRNDLIDDLQPILDFSLPIYDQEIINLVREELKNYKNIFGLINSWNLTGHVYFQYPNENTADVPTFPGYGFFLSTVVQIDLNDFKNLAASSFPRATISKDQSLKGVLEDLTRLYSKKEIIYYSLFDSVVNLDPAPVNISFKNNS